MRRVRGVQARQLPVRVRDDLIARVDVYAARMRVEHPGMELNRSDAVRTLLTRALDAAGVPMVPGDVA